MTATVGRFSVPSSRTLSAPESGMELYGYFRSSAAWRVRIGLRYKAIPAIHHGVHLLREGGEQHAPAYRALNPLGLVPTLVDGKQVLTQSMAILEYLEESHPAPPLLPRDPVARAQVRSWAQAIACDIHPLNNLRVLQYLEREMHQLEPARHAWYRHWVILGLEALELEISRIRPDDRFCWGETPTLADVCLVPQLYNARRYEIELAPYPRLCRAERACYELEAFSLTHPDHQPDAPP